MRAAVIGVGKVATKNYIPFLSEQEDLELGFWNRTASVAVEAAQQYGGLAFDSLDEVLGWQPDIAFVLTSEKIRLPIALKIVHGGVPRIFLEKPLTAAAGQANVTEEDFAGARELLREAEAAGSELAVNFNYRVFSMTQIALARMATGELGTLCGVTARAHFACWSHALDLIGLFAGGISIVSAVSGGVSRTGAGMSAPDLAVSFESSSGAIGSVVGSVAGPWEQSLLDISLEFEYGRIRIWDLDGGVEVLARDSITTDSVRLGAHVSRWDRYAASFRAALDAYLEAVRVGAPPPVPALAGLRELQFEAAIRRAASRGRTIDLENEFPL